MSLVSPALYDAQGWPEDGGSKSTVEIQGWTVDMHCTETVYVSDLRLSCLSSPHVPSPAGH